MLSRSASRPLAVLLKPVVFAFKAPEPSAVLVVIAPAPLPTVRPDRVASVVEEIAPVTARPAPTVAAPLAVTVVAVTAAGVVAPPLAAVCHVAAVPDVAVNTWPTVGAAPTDVFTSVVALFSAFALPEVNPVAVPVRLVATPLKGVPRSGLSIFILVS